MYKRGKERKRFANRDRDEMNKEKVSSAEDAQEL